MEKDLVDIYYKIRGLGFLFMATLEFVHGEFEGSGELKKKDLEKIENALKDIQVCLILLKSVVDKQGNYGIIYSCDTPTKSP